MTVSFIVCNSLHSPRIFFIFGICNLCILLRVRNSFMAIEETCLIIVFEIKSVGIFSKAKLFCHDMMPGKFWPKPAIY